MDKEYAENVMASNSQEVLRFNDIKLAVQRLDLYFFYGTSKVEKLTIHRIIILNYLFSFIKSKNCRFDERSFRLRLSRKKDVSLAWLV